MQKTLNVVALILVILCSGVSFIYFNDDMDIQVPYLKEIFLGIATFLGLVLILRINSRWQSLLLGLRSQGYPISIMGFKKILVYEGISLMYYGLFALIMLFLIDIGFLLGVVSAFYFIEGVLHFAFSLAKKPYKILVNDKSITIITNELTLVRWTDISKIDSRQNDIHLLMKIGAPVLIDLDWLSADDQQKIIAEITKIAQEKKLFCSINCKGTYKDFAKLAMQTQFDD